MIGYQQTIQSEYANSPTLQQLISCIDAWLDQEDNINAFYNNVWNLETATGYGLDVWGRIVGVGRVLNVASGTYFGFAEAMDSSETPFNQEPFYSGETTTSNYALSDDAYRTLIYAKAYANLCNGSIPAINNILMTIFGMFGNAWVTDSPTGFFGFAEAADPAETPFNQQPFYSGTSGGMAMAYNFDFVLSPVDLAIITQSGVLPKPVGVFASIDQI
jgi:hypothetical protein